jgi:hypothetical protein
VDSHFEDHIRRCTPDRHPTQFKISTMGWNEIWSRPVPVMVQQELERYRELFELIVEDLLAFGLGCPILAEGAALLPELIAGCGVAPQRALYLVPTKVFQVHHYRQREWIGRILAECEHPERAFENWMTRDHLFGQGVLQQAERHGYRAIVVDGRRSIKQLAEDASHLLGLN